MLQLHDRSAGSSESARSLTRELALDMSRQGSSESGSLSTPSSGSTNSNSSSSSNLRADPQIPKSHSNWRILDFLKFQNSSKATRSSSVISKSTQKHSILNDSSIGATKHEKKEVSVNKCICCNTILTYTLNVYKFRCSVCDTTNEIAPLSFNVDNMDPSTYPHLISHDYIRKLIKKCFQTNVGQPIGLSDSGQNEDPTSNNHKSLHEIFEPLSLYMLAAFSSTVCLNNSFKVRKSSRRVHYSTSNIDVHDIKKSFILLTKLPTKRPLYNALYGASECLKRINTCLIDDPRNLHWVLVLLEIPFLSRALTHPDSKGLFQSAKSMVDVPEIKSLCYDILKRIFGILAHTESTSAHNYIASWFSKLPSDEFISKVELINLYISFHLKKYFYIANNPNMMRNKSPSQGSSPLIRSPSLSERNSHLHSSPSSRVTNEYIESTSMKDSIEDMNSINSPLSPVLLNTPLSQLTQGINKPLKVNQETKVKIHLYGNDWHLKTASSTLLIFAKANTIRAPVDRIPINSFYNSLVDFVNIKLDFDSWQTNKHIQKNYGEKSPSQPELQTVIDYINGKQNPFNEGASFFFCQYPYLISLGAKISILEYEARRQMERKAEEAFINAIDKRVALDVYFRVKVRRDHIVQDSLRSIKLNSDNLKKSLRVQFINEPGVDAGGLKKEWFLLLTNALFSPETGMLHNVEDSNYLWFNLSTIDNYETYYLFGSILGLAIYNSTILDLKFPISLYKLLLGIPIGLSDYQEMFPVSSSNLFKLRNYSEEELSSLELYFEVSYKNIFSNQIFTKELIERGSSIKVTSENRESYIDKYSQFFMVDGIKERIDSFLKGFSKVVGGNALSLFLPQEIQLILCGSEESTLDIEVLKSITKYNGWTNREEACSSSLVIWFWEYLENLTFKQQKQFLLFVTGSDRVPATGIQNLNFKITRLKNKDSERLPVAHTCFNEIALYEYSSKQKLIKKIDIAVHESSGFGIK